MKTALSSDRTCRELELGQRVIARDYRPTATEKWISGTIISREGPVTYKIDIGNGVTWKRHVDQLRAIEVPEAVGQPLARSSSPQSQLFIPDTQTDIPLTPITPKVPMVISEEKRDSHVDRRYPMRNRRPPERLNYK